jgi:hypothetical protein
MKWRNTKERELLTSSSTNNNNNNSFVDGTDSTTSTKNSISNDKNELCALSNDCCDCQQQKEETIPSHPSLIVNNDGINNSDVDVNDDSRTP